MSSLSEELELVAPGKRDSEKERFEKQAEQNFPYQNNPILQLVYVTFSTDSEKKIVEMELSEHDCYFQVLKKADEIFPLAWTEMVFGDPENLDSKLSNSTDVWNFIQQSKLCKFSYLLIKLKFSEEKKITDNNKCVIC